VLEELENWEIQGDIEHNSSVAGRVHLGRNSRIINSRIRGPVIIGEKVIIEDSFIGPFTSIGDQVKIFHSEIEHSVVLRNSEIRSIEGRIDDSLIGRNVLMKRIGRKPQVHRFILGDNSQVELT
ncbi:MAG: glucose-1-phosphate thymidylyltransferase, partial [bacterium]